MGKTILITFLAGIILNIGISCHHEPNQSLLLAEQSLDNQPGRVLQVLETMELDGLPDSDYALWCLLFTQAQDKTDGLHTTDTIIRFAVSYYEHHKAPHRLARAYYYMGRVAQVLKNAPVAQEYYLKAIKVGEAAKDTAQLPLICNQLGMLYTYQYAYGDALAYMGKSIGYLELLNDTVSQSYVFRNIARTYRQIDSIGQSISYYEKALQYANNFNRSSILSELGDLLIGEKDYERAYSCLQESLSLADEEDYPYVCLALGRWFVENMKTDSAKYYLQKSLGTTVLPTHLGAYFLLSKLARNNRWYEEYMQYQTKYEALRDSAELNIHTQTMVQMQSLYDYQQALNEASRVEREKYTILNTTLWVGLTMLLLICFSIWLGFQLQLKRQKVTMGQETIFRRFQDDRNVIHTQAQIDDNLKIITQLKSEKDQEGKAKESAMFEIRLLELENLWIAKKMEEKELLAKGFESSDLFISLQNEKKVEKINQEDMEKLVDIIDKIYPTFRFRLSCTFKELSPEDLYICYLLKAKIKKIHIGSIIHISRQAINNRCKNMAEELFGNYSSQKIFEQFIDSL